MISEVIIKTKFVKHELKSLCKKINPKIENLTYYIETNYEEYVIIKFLNGYEKKVCVSCDSLKAIVIDVLQNLG